MNIVLFGPDELDRRIAKEDVRAAHVLGVLKRKEGDTFDAGIVNGLIGKGLVTGIDAEGIHWKFTPGEGAASAEAPVAGVHLIVGLPRPQTARKILQEATALGVRAIHFVRTDKGDLAYGTSTLWTSGEWRRHLRAGLEQAFATHEPAVTHHHTLETAWKEAGLSAAIALDNYEAAVDLGAAAVSGPIILAVGGERGWSARERDFFRAQGAVLAHLGRRVLRTETACTAALALVGARLR